MLLLVACAVLSFPACSIVPGMPEAPVVDPVLAQRGGRLFIDPRISGDGERACAGCHPAGGQDGRVWKDGTEVEPGTAGGFNTSSLQGAWQTPPYRWDGSAKTLGDAIDRMLDVEMRGAELAEVDRRALEVYVLSIPPFDRGRVDDFGAPGDPNTVRMRRGFELFGEHKCAQCHPPPRYSWGLRADVGTGSKFDVPTLRGVASSGPWGHDGRWGTLEEAVRAILTARGNELSDLEVEYLLEYLKLL